MPCDLANGVCFSIAKSIVGYENPKFALTLSVDAFLFNRRFRLSLRCRRGMRDRPCHIGRLFQYL